MPCMVVNRTCIMFRTEKNNICSTPIYLKNTGTKQENLQLRSAFQSQKWKFDKPFKQWKKFC